MTSARRIAMLAWLGAALVLASCGDPGHGPARVAFDRDACEHCGMVITDRRFAAQLRIGRTPHRFDDVGCALDWLDERPVPGEPTEFWVMDQESREWIDARRAFFRAGQRTPMGYGFGASAEAGADRVELGSVHAAIRERRAERKR